MSLRTALHRGLSLLVVFSLFLALLPAPALAQEPGADPAPAEGQANSSYLPLVGGSAAAPPPAAPPAPQPEQPAPVPFGDDGEWPVQLAGATGAMRPNLHGPQRSDPAEGIPVHAYSPFDERNNREYPCPPGGCNVMPGQLLLKLAPGVPTVGAAGAGAGTLRTTDAALNATLDELGLVTLTPVFPTAKAPRAGELVVDMDGNVMPKPDLTRWMLATATDPDADLSAAVTTLRAAPRITWVEPVYLRKPVGEAPSAQSEPRPTGRADGAPTAKSEPRPSGRAATTPATALTFNDPLYAQQWHLGATNVPQAWQWLADNSLPPGGNRDIVVAVIDTGVDYTHPDLAANIWTNSREVAGNGSDDDGNGFVDDVHGADTVAGDGGPQDDHGHGTHVAGIIAAQANNGIGGVGVAYNVQIMPIKAAQYSGVLASSDIAEAIIYAVGNGADVINMSFGGYARSQIEEDALATAFGQAVLVAAAGNDGKVNLPCPTGRDMYPAAYNWVLGVMASTQGGSLAGFSNFDCHPRDSHEYELRAPGVGIWSTLPNEQYAAWAGTSMAAPMVAGVAALARTRWPDKDVYSSRFIMGQIASNAGPVANALDTLTVAPQPELTYLEHWTFDTIAQSAANDSDGIVDAGETVDLAIVIRNHWGKADNVQVTLAAQAGVVGPDPYVTMNVGTVDYGAVGSFNIDDNGLIYDDQGTITGVRNPFRFTVDPNTPNDHVIPFKLTMVADNGYDPAAAPLTFTSSFNLVVQRGRELPRIISQDMTLTKDNYWLVPDATLIEAGVYVTVTEGTQIQFWSTDPSNPYAQTARPLLQVEGRLHVQGSASEPVELFSGSQHPNYGILIEQTEAGSVDIHYARVRNAMIGFPSGSPINIVEHSYFDQDLFDSIYWRIPEGHIGTGGVVVRATTISDSIFSKISTVQEEFGDLQVDALIYGNLYDASYLEVWSYDDAIDNVFLKNFRIRPSQGDYLTSQVRSAGYACAGCDALTGRANNPFRRNAILNTWLDPNPKHWMTFLPPNGRGFQNYITDNYWGIASDTLISGAIHDYLDDFNLGEYIYQPTLISPSETTYPFVIDVQLSTDGQSNMSALNGPTPIVGAEPVTFTVTFNRDMDPSVQPAVSFGPDVPETDYTIHAINGGWADARTWQGVVNITPVTGDGYQFMRIIGARAADDPWLVTGDDSERFRFEIITSGTESMNLQANGGEGFVDLSWTQDDFDLLSGFNLYRATTQDGSYARINPSILPPQERTFRDTDVAPGQPYFYKFTVVKSDMTESGFSNFASATPVDTIAPVISHTPVLQAAPGQPLTIAADVTDNVLVQIVTLFHRKSGTTPYSSRAMVKTTGNRYSATLEGSLLVAPGLDYYLEATDGVSPVRHGRPEAPNQVLVQDRPTVTAVAPVRGPAGGGTRVTISGSNFKPGATVRFDNSAAMSVTVVSANQITCYTPPHFPTVADVTVVNPSSESGSLLSGFTYEADRASLSLPDTTAGQGARVQVPINLANVAGMAAADVTITFDPAVLTGVGAQTGSLTPGWTVVANTATAGQVRLSLASAGGTVSGAGVLARLEFDVAGAPGVTTTLHVASVRLNDGAIPVDAQDGVFTVDLVYYASGSVTHWNGGAVSGTLLSLAGDRLFTAPSDASGQFTVGGAPRGAYVLTPAKSDDVKGISAYDAALALQHAAGVATLSGAAFTAADVNGSSEITAMDAFYILQKAVDLIPVPFPGAGQVWAFTPASRTYADLAANENGQDFTAILIGDPSGNWASAATRAAATADAPLVLRVAPAVGNVVTATLWLAGDVGPIHAVDLALQGAGATVQSIDVALDPRVTGWIKAANVQTDGRIHLALAGAQPVTGAGALAVLRFTLAEPGAGLQLTAAGAALDEAAAGVLVETETPNAAGSVFLPLLAR
jgi:subtilisin family serine protease